MKRDFKTRSGVDDSIQINVLDRLPKDRYLAALKRIRKAIAEGRGLSGFDSDAPGAKNTSCSWGMCHESKKTWPDAKDHTFPIDFIERGRISALDLDVRKGQKCPLDKREKVEFNGCFYTCRYFQGPKPSKEKALNLYDQQIAITEREPTMNKDRRNRLNNLNARLRNVRNDLDAITDEEREAFDNMPDSLKDSDAGQEREQIVDSLREQVDALEDVIDAIQECIG